MRNLLKGISTLLFLMAVSCPAITPKPNCGDELLLAKIVNDPVLAEAVQGFLNQTEIALRNVPGNSLVEKIKSITPSALDLEPKKQVGIVNRILRDIHDPDSWLVRLVEFQVGNHQRKSVELHARDGFTSSHAVTRQVLPLHHLTGAFFIKETGERVALEKIVEALVNSAPEQPNAAFLLVDLNFLGKVNYFQAQGYEGGDTYIRSFGETIREVLTKNLRTTANPAASTKRKIHTEFPSDIVFTSGGDEFFIILQDVSPNEVGKIVTRLQAEFQKNEKVKALFLLQEEHIRARLDEAYVLTGSTPPLRSSSPTSFLGYAQLPIPNSEALPYFESLHEFLRIKPSITVGGAMIRKGKNYASIFREAEVTYIRAKREFMEALGLDASKYGGRSSEQLLSNTPTTPPFYLIQ